MNIWDIKTIKTCWDKIIKQCTISIILKVNNSPVELGKDFKPINVSIDDMDKLKDKEITKQGTITKAICFNWYDWLINYIFKPIKRQRLGLKTNLTSF